MCSGSVRPKDIVPRRKQDLVARTAELLEVAPAAVEQAIGLEVAADNLTSEVVRGEPALFLTPLHRAESGVAGHLRRLLEGRPPWGTVDGDKAIPWVETLTGLSLSESQREAVATVLNGKVTVLTGGPGVGKTTIVNSILRLVEGRGGRVLLCAPTGRAAKRLSESAGAEARTIHRLLEFDPRHGGFRRDEADPLEVGPADRRRGLDGGHPADEPPPGKPCPPTRPSCWWATSISSPR